MKDKDKQIEEMAIQGMATVFIKASCKGSECEKCLFIDSVEEAKECCVCLKALYNAGYRKLPKDSVVLTREEYEDLQVGKDFDYGYHEGYKNTEAYYENFALPQTRKETAEKILRKGEECYYDKYTSANIAFNKFAEWIRNEFNVEIKE